MGHVIRPGTTGWLICFVDRMMNSKRRKEDFNVLCEAIRGPAKNIGAHIKH